MVDKAPGSDTQGTPPGRHDGFLSERDAAEFRKRGFYIPAGRHTLYASAIFEPPFFVGSGFDHFRGSIGAFTYSHAALDGAQKVGRYCSIANGAAFGGGNHPTSWISTSQFQYSRSGFFADWLKAAGETYEPHARDSNRKENGAIEMGNDVWIGRGCWIRRGVRIADGAIIGAHCVVTKNVEPFCVMAGNPARVIRRRFSDPMIERIQRVKWWDYKFPDFNRLPAAEPGIFLDQLEERIARHGLKPYRPEPLTGAQLIAVLQESPA